MHNHYHKTHSRRRPLSLFLIPHSPAQACNLAVGEFDAVGEDAQHEFVEGACQVGALAAHLLEIGPFERIQGGRERSEAYGSNFSGKNETLSPENTRFWNENSKFMAT